MRKEAGRRLREAFARATAGRQKSIAAESFPDRSVAQAESELSAILAGSRRPTWALLEHVLALSPESLLDVAADLARVRFERLPQSEAASLERIASQLDALRAGQEQLELELGQVLGERKPAIAKASPRRRSEVA